MSPLAVFYDEIGVLNTPEESDGLLGLPGSAVESNTNCGHTLDPEGSSIRHVHSIFGRSNGLSSSPTNKVESDIATTVIHSHS